MNTSHTSRSLSAEQLEAFLEGTLPPDEMQRVQHLLDDCELSREALEGYAIVPGAFADVEGLKKAIAAKSGMSWTWGKIGWSVIGVAVISVLVTWFYPTGEISLAGNEPAEEQKQHVAPQYPEPVNSLSPDDDHFVNPEAKVVPVIVPGEMKVNTDGNAVVAPTEQEFVVEPIPAEQHEHLITDSVRPVESKKTEIIYNAQVGFIVDLKVTEYDTYYATPVEVRELRLTGTPAKYETEDGLGDSKEEKDEEPVRLVPADQFLREGLLAFRDGRYGKCISKMEVLLDKNPNDINALFYTAVSYVKLEMYSKAIPLLDQIIDAENNVFDEEAEWYKALALEGNGDDAAAQELFKKISADGGFYAKQAATRVR
jgi:hypothetical protein